MSFTIDPPRPLAHSQMAAFIAHLQEVVKLPPSVSLADRIQFYLVPICGLTIGFKALIHHPEFKLVISELETKGWQLHCREIYLDSKTAVLLISAPF